jgi:hypothetical protein
MLQEVEQHFRFDTLEKFSVNPDVGAILALTLAKAAANLNLTDQIVFGKKPFETLGVYIVAAGKT